MVDHDLYRMLNDISEKLGGLAAKVEGMQEASERREIKIDAINQHVSGLLELPERVADAEAGVKEFRELKQRGYGALAMAGLLGGGVVGGIVTFFDKFTGGSN
jgi:hypothetical protein